MNATSVAPVQLRVPSPGPSRPISSFVRGTTPLGLFCHEMRERDMRCPRARSRDEQQWVHACIDRPNPFHVIHLQVITSLPICTQSLCLMPSLTPWQANSEAKRQLSPSPPFYSISSSTSSILSFWAISFQFELRWLVPLSITVSLLPQSLLSFFRSFCSLLLLLARSLSIFVFISPSVLRYRFALGYAPDLAPRSPEPEPPPWSRSP